MLLKDTEPFKSYLATRRSAYTFRACVSDFGNFKKRMNKDLHLATEEDLLDYFNKVSALGLSDRTKSRYKGLISAFFKYLQAKHVRPDDPSIVLRLISIDPPQGKPKALTPEQLEQLLNALRWDTFHEFKMSLFVVIGLDTGLRLHEICKLHKSEVHLDTQRIGPLVRKGRKIWSLKLANRSFGLIKQWYALTEANGVQSEWVFFSPVDYTKHVHLSGPAAWYETIKKRLGWGKEIKFSSHVARHVFCSIWGNDPEIPMGTKLKASGHSGADIFQKYYVRTDDAQVDAGMDKHFK